MAKSAINGGMFHVQRKPTYPLGIKMSFMECLGVGDWHYPTNQPAGQEVIRAQSQSTTRKHEALGKPWVLLNTNRVGDCLLFIYIY